VTMAKIIVSDTLVRAAMLVSARRFEVPPNTRLRSALEQLAIELDTWAVSGSEEKRQRRQSRAVLRKVGVRK